MGESVVERELAIRLAATAWLDGQRARGQEMWTQAQLADFQFEGVRLPLMDRERGIRKPAGMAAALSIRTVFTATGGRRPYEDGAGPDGLLRYMWRGDDPQHAENRALREAMARQLRRFAPAAGAREDHSSRFALEAPPRVAALRTRTTARHREPQEHQEREDGGEERQFWSDPRDESAEHRRSFPLSPARDPADVISRSASWLASMRRRGGTMARSRWSEHACRVGAGK